MKIRIKLHYSLS